MTNCAETARTPDDRMRTPKYTPGGMTAAGDRDGAVGVLDDELEAQVARSS